MMMDRVVSLKLLSFASHHVCRQNEEKRKLQADGSTGETDATERHQRKSSQDWP